MVHMEVETYTYLLLSTSICLPWMTVRGYCTCNLPATPEGSSCKLAASLFITRKSEPVLAKSVSEDSPLLQLLHTGLFQEAGTAGARISCTLWYKERKV